MKRIIKLLVVLALLLASAICGGLALAGFILPGTSASLIWQLLAGPAGYFSTVALALHFWAGRLYRWQLCCIFTAGALLLPWLVCPLTGAHPITTLCALGVGLTTATVELCVFFGRDYFEITSASRTRSTVICIQSCLCQFHGKVSRHGFCQLHRLFVGFFAVLRLGDLSVVQLIQTNCCHGHSSIS